MVFIPVVRVGYRSSLFSRSSSYSTTSAPRYPQRLQRYIRPVYPPVISQTSVELHTGQCSIFSRYMSDIRDNNRVE